MKSYRTSLIQINPMTPDQLERIKAYIGKVRYDQTSRELQSDTIVIPILDTAVGYFIEIAINEKLERINCPGVTPPTITLIDFAPSICTNRPHEIDQGSNTCKHCGTVYLHLPSNSKT